MLNRLNTFIQNHELFDKTDKIGLAISGGKDSVALAFMLNQLQYSFILVHCNFMLRGEESNEDEKFIKNLARTLPYCSEVVVKQFDTEKYAEESNINIQVAARQLRYTFFDELIEQKRITKLLTAHHKTDVVETFFINLLRGSGIKGLKSIPIKRAYIVRPFLDFYTDEILEYLEKENIFFREDSSNKTNKYLRNKLRNVVLPKLREELPGLDDAVIKSAQTLAAQNILLRHFLDEIGDKICERSAEGDIISISISAISTYPQSDVILYHLLDKYGFNFTQCQQIIESASQGSGKIFEGKNCQLLIHQDSFLVQQSIVKSIRQIEIFGEGIYQFNNARLVIERTTETVFTDNPLEETVTIRKEMFPLTLRYWQQGDYFSPLGMKGKKLLSDFFIDTKLSIFDKHSVPLLCKDENVLWVCGKRVSNNVKAQKKEDLYILNIIFEV